MKRRALSSSAGRVAPAEAPGEGGASRPVGRTEGFTGGGLRDSSDASALRLAQPVCMRLSPVISGFAIAFAASYPCYAGGYVGCDRVGSFRAHAGG